MHKIRVSVIINIYYNYNSLLLGGEKMEEKQEFRWKKALDLFEKM